jgi:hypothetical protein
MPTRLVTRRYIRPNLEGRSSHETMFGDLDCEPREGPIRDWIITSSKAKQNEIDTDDKTTTNHILSQDSPSSDHYPFPFRFHFNSFQVERALTFATYIQLSTSQVPTSSLFNQI